VKKYVVIIALLMASATQAVEIAKYAGEFMSVGVGARSLAMGGAFVAIGGDVTNGYWNPSGLATIRYPELAAMHARQFGGMVNYDYAGFAIPFRKQEGLAISMVRLAVDDIYYTALPRPSLPIDAVYTNEDGQVVGNRPYISKTVSDGEYAFYMSYGRQRSTRFSYGANIKMVHKGVGDHSAWGLGFDLGALWNPIGVLQAGVNIQDITTTLLAWDTGTRELIAPTVKTGLAYPFYFGFIKTGFLLAADTDIRFENRQFASQAHLGRVSMDFHMGAELLFRRTLAIRVGSDTGHLSAGAGIRLPRLDLDYAFLSHQDLDNTHRISLRVRIEEARFARK
jgi:hypothetical protein